MSWVFEDKFARLLEMRVEQEMSLRMSSFLEDLSRRRRGRDLKVKMTSECGFSPGTVVLL
jgi:hypothetical protein